MSDMRVVGRTFYKEEIYEGDEVIRTPSGDLIFPEDLLIYATTIDDFEMGELFYDGVNKEIELECADMITDIRRDENFND